MGCRHVGRRVLQMLLGCVGTSSAGRVLSVWPVGDSPIKHSLHRPPASPLVADAQVLHGGSLNKRSREHAQAAARLARSMPRVLCATRRDHLCMLAPDHTLHLVYLESFMKVELIIGPLHVSSPQHRRTPSGGC